MLERVRTRMDQDDIEVLAITHDMNIEYLLDVHPPGPDGLSGVLLVTQEDWRFIVSKFFRYSFEDVSNVDIYTDRDELKELVEDSVLEDGCHTDDPSHFSTYELEGTGIIEQCRMTKTDSEIERMRQACDIGSMVFEDVLEAFEPGMTEWDVVSRVESGFRRREVTDAFTAQAHASTLEPHRGPKSEEIEPGETVLLDMGCRSRGYCSDMTRMLPNDLDDGPKELVADLGAVQSQVLDRVQAGMEAGELARTAHDLVEDRGYSVSEHYLHSLGHGVGLSVHEGPQLHAASEAVLEVGMVITIEPGLYVPGTGGARIEDQVVVHEDGYERLTGQRRFYER
jgi:Xaa-Pro aminopeptidase